jgi:hypothetical protein
MRKKPREGEEAVEEKALWFFQINQLLLTRKVSSPQVRGAIAPIAKTQTFRVLDKIAIQ